MAAALTHTSALAQETSSAAELARHGTPTWNGGGPPPFSAPQAPFPPT
jgi:hypothetical protein